MADVPDDVLGLVWDALENFNTSESIAFDEVNQSLTLLEQAWKALRPYVPTAG